MKHLKLFIALCLILLTQATVRATPFFARTYDMTCKTCHAGYPRLNEFGLKFKANNFRIAGMDAGEFLAWQKTLPVSVQVSRYNEKFLPGKGHADYTDTQVLAGGLLTKKTAFYLHHSLWIDNVPVPFPTYDAWVQQVLDEKTKTMLKIGQFELPYAYSPGTHLVSAFPPQIFGVGLAGNDVRLGSALRGVQLSGLVADKARWYLAYGTPSTLTPGNINGRHEFLGQFHDVFARVSTSGFDKNIGAFTYLTDQARNPADPGSTERGYRLGLDGSYLWRDYQFFAMSVYGEDKDPLGDGRRGTFRSGFVEADKMLLPWVGVNLRLEAQSVSVGGRQTYSDGKGIGLRVYPVPFVRLTAEYIRQEHDRSESALSASTAF